MRLYLHIIAQAVEDVLRYELGLPLVGVLRGPYEDLAYHEALAFLSKYPAVLKRIKKKSKIKLLKEINDARS